MADNYLERHREEYEQRKQAWLKKKKHIPKAKQKASANRPHPSVANGDSLPFVGPQPHWWLL